MGKAVTNDDKVRPAHPPTAQLLGITALLAAELLLELVWALGSGYGAATGVRALLVVVGALVRVGLLIAVWSGKAAARRGLAGVGFAVGAVVLLAAVITVATGGGAAAVLGFVGALLAFAGAYLAGTRAVRAWCEGEPRGMTPSQDALGHWAAQRGWRISWNVPPGVLGQFRGTPFHMYRRKGVPVLAVGQHQGAPAMVTQINFWYRYQTTGRSYYSSGQLEIPRRTREMAGAISVAVVELPAPVPELWLDEKRDALDGVLDLFHLNRSQQLFPPRPLAEIDVVEPSTSKWWNRYHVFGTDPAYAHAVLTPQRAFWLYTSLAGLPSAGGTGAPYIRLSGRKLVVWTARPLVPEVADRLLQVTEEVARWIPSAAYQDPAGAQADQQHVPLAQLRLG